jgi:hypothetical protein
MGPAIKKSAELASVALATAAMILCEIVVGNHANFVFSDAFQLYLPLIVFGSIALGSLLGLWRPFEAMPLSRLLLVAAVAVLAGFLGLAHALALGAVWVALPIVAFGVYLCRVLCEVSLKTVVWALGIGGALLYLLYEGIIGALGDGLVVVIVALTVAAALVLEPRRQNLAAGALVVLVAGVCLASGAFETRSFAERSSPSFDGSERLRPPLFTPLIRTDLLRLSGGDRVMITNGSRFARVRARSHAERVLAGGSNGFYDSPYFAGGAESVLVIGSAEGENILSALGNGAKQVVAVDVNPAVFQIMKHDVAPFSGGVYNDPRVVSIASEGRRFLEVTPGGFDVITLQGVQTGSTSNLVSTALIESFLFTQEAMAAAWRALSPRGVLFYEEYQRFRDDMDGTSLLGILAGSAPSALGITDVEHQIVFFSYVQSGPNAQLASSDGHSRVREGLLLYKTPLDDEALARVHARLLDRATLENVPTGVSGTIVDDRPFFIQTFLPKAVATATLSIPVVLGAALVLFAWTRARRSATAPASLALFLAGMGFMLLILGITGPASLLLGDPQLATPVVFVAVYAWGLVGGLLALRAGKRAMLSGILGLVAYLVVLAVALAPVKAAVLGIGSLAARVLVVSLLLLPAALLAELPYIHLLNRFEGRARGKAYAWENVGTMVAIPMGFALQVTRGFTADLIGAAVIYLAALLVLVPEARGSG